MLKSAASLMLSFARRKVVLFDDHEKSPVFFIVIEILYFFPGFIFKGILLEVFLESRFTLAYFMS